MEPGQGLPVQSDPKQDVGFFAGVDWGGTFHQLCVLNATGGLVLQQRINHDVAGLELLARKLARLGAPVAVAIERGEGLLVEFLHTLPAVTLYCVSPKISARARERYRLSASKSDAFDAFVLADTLRHEHSRWRPMSRPSPLTAELQAVSRDRQRVLHAKVACESRLRAVMDAYHPAPALVLRTGPQHHPGVYPRLSHAGAGSAGEGRTDGRVLRPATLQRAHRSAGAGRPAPLPPVVGKCGHHRREGVRSNAVR